MEFERPNQRDLTPEELAHLAKLKQLVQSALADGKVSQPEIQAIRALIHADHKVTFEELQTIHNTTRELLGNDGILEYDWG
jgi:uncharacterized tellurite resistance protein B-like protein